ncbi:hypothetical protein HPP92_015887 [Vanilla planifolia]|uniref:Tyrosinase copper-binding domain-containing protein n=1 Tax=Vanilla planifolia TaxID=51239 RepID=A0A835P8D1_VANPL|nr:hypothetical protein HPP92_027635 [Vanilla planifolia]KAG0471341.1 hypothetical protein HPP92_015887 [Vanilla planifolia]
MASITPFLAYAFPSRPTSVPTIPMRSLIQPQFKSVACRATINENDNNHHRESNSSLQRRGLLIGLGGLYGAAAGIGTEQLAVANPIQAPDLLKCGQSIIPPNGTPINCCPPYNSTIVDFVPPTHGLHRVRRAAHLVDDKYLAKYQKAVALMKALPYDDPRNFTQQANIHCAYCSGGYDQVGFPDLELQVHNSWLFFPFHRFYLYFHERILGKLIGDDNFALPFWNWDSPAGMQIPSFYNEKSSSLYNERRDPQHLPPTIVDLDNNTNSTLTPGELIDDNLKIMHREMISNGKTAILFMGAPYRAGDLPGPGAGSLENIPHGTVHRWTGDSRQPNREDMGIFYSAARDPIFYAHHSNIDRLWSVWKTLGGKRRDFTDHDWLDSSFLFYDENAQLVRVKVKDCLKTEKLGYKYQDVANPWINSPRSPRVARNGLLTRKLEAGEPVFPVTLKKPVTATVKRPKKGRNKKEKEEEEEVIVVEGILFDRSAYVKFNVFINSSEEVKLRPSESEFAGSFVNVPHKHGQGKKHAMMTTNLRLGITDLLEDLGAEDDDSVKVTLVPVTENCSTLKISGIRIEFSS